MLYSKDGSFPQSIPNRIRLSNGYTRTDSTTFTPEEIADAGYVLVDFPPEVIYPNKVEWIGSAWITREPTQAEINYQWDIVRSERNRLLAKSDIEVLRCYELSIPVPLTTVTYRQELRDLPQVQTDPFNIIWPTLAVPVEPTIE